MDVLYVNILMPKWKRNTFDIIENNTLSVLIITIKGCILFDKDILSNTRKFKDKSDIINVVFVTIKAVNDQKIFLREDEVIFFISRIRMKDIIRKVRM